MEVIYRGGDFVTDYGDTIAVNQEENRFIFTTRKHAVKGGGIEVSKAVADEFLKEGEDFGWFEEEEGEGIWAGYIFYTLINREVRKPRRPKPKIKIPENTCGYCSHFHHFLESEEGLRVCKREVVVDHKTEACSFFETLEMMCCHRPSLHWKGIFVCSSNRAQGKEVCVECRQFCGDDRYIEPLPRGTSRKSR